MPTPTKNPSLSFQSLELRLSQLQRVTDRSRASKYSDERKKEFHDSIIKVVDSLNSQDFSKFSEEQLTNTHIVIERLFKWLEFLVNSTINQTPYEIINCLELVLSDWIDYKDKYLLLTALSSNKDRFAFEYDKQPRVLKTAKECMFKDHGVEIKQDIIRIILPRFLSHDYLTAVSLYHEIAHFIDWRYGITDEIIYNHGLGARKDISTIKAAYQEYFADLFAAQYIKEASCSHIVYLTHGAPKPIHHPETADRVAMVKHFLSGKKPKGELGEKFQDIKDTVKRVTSKELQIRFQEVAREDFNNLVPVEIKNTSQLHGLFITAWEIWLDEKSELRKKFANRYDLYRILNNLVEKSISNYFLTKSWENVPNR